MESAGGSRTPVGAPPTLPEVFGRYRILKRVGQGGMGTVYLAQDGQLQRQVALKVPQFAGKQGAEMVQRFYREARMAATFHHANLCPVYDVGEIQGIHYLTMPFLAGESLSDWLRRAGPLPPATACRLAALVAGAVHVAHEAGILHRDLKPSNVKLPPGGGVKLLDFGLAKTLELEGDPSSAATLVKRTDSGIAVGRSSSSTREACGRPRARSRREKSWTSRTSSSRISSSTTSPRTDKDS